MSIIRQGFESADLDVPVVLPTLNLDFANSQSLDSRITFSRGSIGTRVNINGLIETIAANQPRFDFDPISGECKGLLIEESRSNLITYSEDFSQGIWSKPNCSIQSNVITAPDGNTTADKFVEDTTKFGHQLIQDISLTASTTYTRTIFVKVAEKSRIRIRVADTATFTKSAQVDFNIARGVVLNTFGSGVTFVSSSISPLTNGWYRCSMTYTIDATGGTYRQSFWLLSDDAGTTAYQGDGTSGIYIWGAQLEQGAFPTSYIPTSGSTVTRSVDNAEMIGTNFSSWYNQTEGTFFYNGTLPFITNDTVTRVPFGVSNGFNFSNSIYVSKTPTTLGLSFVAINNNVSQTQGTSLPTMTSSKIKIASSVAPNNIYSCGYGGVVNKSLRTSAAIPPATRLTLGKEPWNGSALNPIIGCINKFAYYPKALSPAQLQYLTQ